MRKRRMNAMGNIINVGFIKVAATGKEIEKNPSESPCGDQRRALAIDRPDLTDKFSLRDNHPNTSL